MKLGNILKNCGLLLLCSVLCADFSMATNSDSLEVETNPQTKLISSLQITADDAPKLLQLLALPDETLANITSALDKPKDILNFGTTCRRLHVVSEIDASWKPHLEKLPGHLPADPRSEITYKDRVIEHYILVKIKIAMIENGPEKLRSLLLRYGKNTRIQALGYYYEYWSSNDDVRELVCLSNIPPLIRVLNEFGVNSSINHVIKYLNGEDGVGNDDPDSRNAVKEYLQKHDSVLDKDVRELLMLASRLGKYEDADEARKKTEELSQPKMHLKYGDSIWYSAFYIKLLAYTSGEYGFGKNPNAARQTIEQQLELGNHQEMAFHHKLYGMVDQDYGYGYQGTEKIKQFIEDSVLEGIKAAIRIKYLLLARGNKHDLYGIEKDEREAANFLKQLGTSSCAIGIQVENAMSGKNVELATSLVREYKWHSFLPYWTTGLFMSTPDL